MGFHSHLYLLVNLVEEPRTLHEIREPTGSHLVYVPVHATRSNHHAGYMEHSGYRSWRSDVKVHRHQVRYEEP